MTTVISIGVVSLIVTMLGYVNVTIIRDHDQRQLWKQVARAACNWRYILIIIPSLLILAPAGMFIYSISPSWLQWSWWYSIGGEGNVVFGSVDATQGTWMAIIPIACMVLLTAAVPVLAHAEELDFRCACPGYRWRWTIVRSLLFGLVHAIMGVPLVICLTTLAASGFLYELIHYRAYTRSLDATIGVMDEPSKKTLVTVLRFHNGDYSDKTLDALRGNTYISNSDGLKHTESINKAIHAEAKIASAAAHTIWNWSVITIIITLTITSMYL